MSEHIQVERNGSIVTIRMSRSAKKNALTIAMYTAMSACLHDTATDDTVRVLLLAGADGVFTSGNDLADFAARPPIGADSPVLTFLHRLSTYPKPIVAAVNGVAIGIGTTMLLHCDLAIADAGTRFSLPFINLGLVPEAASSLLLPQMLGHARASELLLLGDVFDAAAAERYGIINRVSEPGSAEAKAIEWAQQLASKPAVATRKTKALLKAASRDIATRMQEEAADFGAQLAGPEFREAVNAFMEKRPPRFN